MVLAIPDLFPRERFRPLKQVEYEKLTELDKPFRPKNGEHFVVFHNSPTPVS